MVSLESFDVLFFQDAFKVDILLKTSKVKLSLSLSHYPHFTLKLFDFSFFLVFSSICPPMFIFFLLFTLQNSCCVCDTRKQQKTGETFWQILHFMSSLPPCLTSSRLFASPTVFTPQKCDFLSSQQKCVLSLANNP